MNRPLNILVIEDVYVDLLLIKRCLRKYELNTECHSIGSYAELDAVLPKEWDLVISDYNVPGMNFGTTLERIHAHHPNLPVILVSGHIGEEKVMALLRQGLTNFIHKNNLTRLADIIWRALSEADERNADQNAEITSRESRETIPTYQHQAQLTALNLIEEALTARAEAAHDELQNSEAKYRLLAENSADWIFWLGPDGCFKYVSPACQQISGYQPEEFLANAELMSNIIHPEDQQAHQWLLNKNAHTDHIECEFRIIHKDGSLRWINNSCKSITNEDGEYLGQRGSYRDITASKRAEEQLRKLAQAVEQSPASIIITNLNSEIEYVNEFFLHNTGYSRNEIIGQKSSILDSNKTPRETYESLKEAMRRGQTWKGEFINKRKDGSEYVELAIINPIRQPDGRITHYVAVKEDITERKIIADELNRYRYHLEEVVEKRTLELRQQSQSLQALIDNLPHMAWLKDKEGRFIAVNRTLAELKGYETEALLGKSDFDLWSQETAECYRTEDQEVMATGLSKTTEMPIDSVSGSLYEVFVAPIHDADGASLGTVGFARDIKPQRDLQEELARRAEAAEAATRAKSAFLANMSHEIRTPMNAIIGLTYLLRQSALTTEQSNRLDKIDAAAQHLLSIINDVLDLSKIEAGHLELEQTDFALGTILDHIRSLVSAQAKAKDLDVEIDYDGVPEWLRGDPTRLRQAILNYVSNAIKFTERGTIWLRVKLLEENAEELLVRFDVQDTGIGIPQKSLPVLFEAFTQADVSTTRKYGGTGLGLAITQRLAKMMGGEVGVDILQNQGSIFWFTAKLRRGHSVTTREAQQSKQVEIILRNHFAGHRLLLVEDNPINREVALELLHSVDLTVDTAENGQDALEKIRANTYALVLMDVQMPVMDGLTATKAIRTQLGQADLPVLAMTANAFGENKQACLTAGMNDFVAKPVIPEALYEALLRWLPKSKPNYILANDLLDQARASLKNIAPEQHSHRSAKYHHLLDMFVKSHRKDMKRVLELLVIGDVQEAHQLTHAFRGVALTLGAGSVADLATQLEKALLANATITECVNLAQQCDNELTKLAATIESIPKTTEAPETNRASFDPQQIQLIFSKLETLLAENNVHASRLALESTELLKATLDNRYEIFNRQINAFDYEGALMTLREMNQ